MLDITKLKLNDILVYKNHPDRGECSFIKIVKDEYNNEKYFWFLNEYDEVMCVTIELACNLFEMKHDPHTETFDATKLIICETYYQLTYNGLTQPVIFQSYNNRRDITRKVQFFDMNGAPCSCSEAVAVATFMTYNGCSGVYEYLFEQPKSCRLKWVLVNRLNVHPILFDTHDEAKEHIDHHGLQYAVVSIEIPD